MQTFNLQISFSTLDFSTFRHCHEVTLNVEIVAKPHLIPKGNEQKGENLIR